MSKKLELWKNKQWLIDHYVNSKLLLTDISILASCSTATLSTWINKFDLPKRQINISKGLKNSTCDLSYRCKKRKNIDIELLKYYYCNCNKPIREICKLMNSDYSTIRNRLESLNIEIKPCYYYSIGIKKSAEFCKKLSLSQKGRKNTWQLGDLNPSKRPEVKLKISNALKGKPRPKTTGVGNGNWHGGISFAKYSVEFTNELKEDVRNSFGNKCFLCGATKKENNNREIVIHHIDYNKHNNNIDNLVPLCNKDHGRTNFSRKFWTSELKILLFSNKLKKVLELD